MTIPEWPSGLPQYVLVDGFQSGSRGGRLVTKTEYGMGKQRPRGPMLRTMLCQQNLSFDQRAMFDVFWEETLHRGTVPFIFTDPHLDEETVLDEGGTLLFDESGHVVIISSYVLCTFGGDEPAWVPLGGRYFQLHINLTILP